MVTKTTLYKKIRARLKSIHKNRLRGIVLYGSEARGDARSDSDIDLLVLLEEPIELGRDMEANLTALYPLSIEVGRRISAKPVGSESYEKYDCPLHRNAHREGILL